MTTATHPVLGPLHRAWKSSSFRLALCFSAVVVSILVGTLSVYYVEIVGTVSQRLDDYALRNSKRLLSVYAQHGEAGLVEEIQRLVSDGIDSQDEIFIYQHLDGAVWAGNATIDLVHAPRVAALQDLPVEQEARSFNGRVKIDDLGQQRFLIVGSDLQALTDIQHRYMKATALALGLAVGLSLLGVGDVGAAVTLALMPAMLAEHGWRAVMRGCAVVVAVTGALYVSAVSRDAPSLGARSLRGMLAPLRYAEGWRLGLAYASTFGVFVALALQGPALLVDAFRCTPGAARLTVVIFVATAGLARVPGGVLADRFGARAVLDGALVTMCTALTAMALHPTPAAASALLFLAGLASGVGSAAALLLVPRRFPTVTGAAGGVVGALGATLGFALPLLGDLLRREMRLTTAALVPMIALAYASLLFDHVAARRREGASLPRRSATA